MLYLHNFELFFKCTLIPLTKRLVVVTWVGQNPNKMCYSMHGKVMVLSSTTVKPKNWHIRDLVWKQNETNVFFFFFCHKVVKEGMLVRGACQNWLFERAYARVPQLSFSHLIELMLLHQPTHCHKLKETWKQGKRHVPRITQHLKLWFSR